MTVTDVPAPGAQAEQEPLEEHDLRPLARALLAHALHVHANSNAHKIGKRQPHLPRR